MATDTYKRVKQCPICGKRSCSVSKDGAIAICWRVIDGAFKIGANGQGIHHLNSDVKLKASAVAPKPPVDYEYWSRYIREGRMAYSASDFKLGEKLGLSEESLGRIGVGLLSAKTLTGSMKTSCAGRFSWSFPMYNEFGRPIGIRLRSESGFKYAADGSRNGLTIPAGTVKPGGHMHVVEGPTDTAAALDLGMDAIGRPMNVGLTDMIAACVMRYGPMRLTIITDRDAPDSKAHQATSRGANELRDVMPKSVDVLITYPPGTAKDLREYLINRR